MYCPAHFSLPTHDPVAQPLCCQRCSGTEASAVTLVAELLQVPLPKPGED